MTEVATFVFLSIAAGVLAISSLGVLTMDDVFDRLHYVGPAASLAPTAVALAVLFDDGLSSAAVKSFLTAGFLLVLGPVVSHATARAARMRQFGHTDPMPQERRVDLGSRR